MFSDVVMIVIVGVSVAVLVRLLVARLARTALLKTHSVTFVTQMSRL